MTTFARLLTSPALEVAGQMALDETLLNAALPFPCLRIYNWPAGGAPFATFGYAQRYEAIRATLPEPFLKNHCTRRLTGGGIVLHDEDMTFSVVFPLNGAPWKPLETYRVFHAAIADALRMAGVETVLAPVTVAPAVADPDGEPAGEGSQAPVAEAASQCFLEPVAFDLLDRAGNKVLGGALRHRRGHALYQGSLRLPGARNERRTALAVAIQRAFSAIFHADALLSMSAPGIPEGVCARYASRKWIHLR